MKFDFGNALNPAINAAANISAMNEDAINAVDIRNRQRDKAERAMIDAAQHTAEIQGDVRAINGRVDEIGTGLDNERAAREQAEKENMRYVKKMDRISLFLAIIAAVTGIAALVVSLVFR